MSRKFRYTVFTLLITVGAAAQMREMPFRGSPDPHAQSQVVMEMQRRELRKPNDRKRLNAEKRRLEFAERVQKFTESWNKLMADGAKGLWDPKQAKAARKAFESVLESEGWLEAK